LWRREGDLSLTYTPFIGAHYEMSRILIVGESNPDIGGWTTAD